MVYRNRSVPKSVAANRRCLVLLRLIEDNPGISHNKLRDIVVNASGDDHMANKTFQGQIGNLIQSGQVIVKKDRNKKRYYLSDPRLDTSMVEMDVESEVKRRDDELSILKERFTRFTTESKVGVSIYAILALYRDLNALTLMSIFKGDTDGNEAAQKHFTDNIKSIYEMIRNDDDCPIILPQVVNHVSGKHHIALESIPQLFYRERDRRRLQRNQTKNKKKSTG